MGTEELQVTAPTEWGKKKEAPVEDGLIVPLPSGNVVKVRRTMNMLALLRSGRVPNPLAGIVQKMIDTGNIDLAGALKQKGPESAKASQQLLDLLDENWMTSVIEPEFDAPPLRGKIPTNPKETQEEYLERLAGWKPEEGKVSIFDVEADDKMYVFSVSQGAAVDLARFREEQDAALDLVHTDAPVQSTSV